MFCINEIAMLCHQSKSNGLPPMKEPCPAVNELIMPPVVNEITMPCINEIAIKLKALVCHKGNSHALPSNHGLPPMKKSRPAVNEIAMPCINENAFDIA